MPSRKGPPSHGLSRRNLLLAGGGGIAASVLPVVPALALKPRPRITLTAAPGQAPIAAPDNPSTDVWAYNGTVPGQVLRVKQGDELRVRFRNNLPQPSSVHWHGIRLPNAMDGVAGLTQDPVPPGGTFDYTFTVPDAGTFWYHPHHRTWEQMARGLYGALIVEERTPVPVDRDLVLVLDDWRLGKDGQIHTASFGSMMDMSHAGRMGNWLNVNGRSRPRIAVTSGERLRLRLINAANSRIMGLRFDDHAPMVVALDGQPVPPRPVDGGLITLAPAQRMDVVVEMTGAPGSRAAMRLVSVNNPIPAAHFVYGPGQKKREAALPPVTLPDNPIPRRLDLNNAIRTNLVMEGGAMGRMGYATYQGRRQPLRELAGQGMIWAFNGVVGRTGTPLLEAKRGRTVVINMINDTSWPHAMHLHGFHFTEIERNGKPVSGAPWRDTVLTQRGERVSIAFVADNPGKWLLHCHMLEHQAAGMTTWVSVKA